MTKSFSNIHKHDLACVDISLFSACIPDLKNTSEPKFIIVADWLIKVIEDGIANDKIHHGELLPSKSDFAYLLGVSIGTMQNAFRHVEDLEHVISKQCIGTFVSDNKHADNFVRKLTSKRDLAVEAIKRYIISDKFSVGEILPSSRTIATIIGFSSNTTRLAIDYLVSKGIIERKFKNYNEYNNCILKSINFELSNFSNLKSQTLVDKIVEDLEDYISKNLKVGDRLPAHEYLADMLHTSIKTVHDSLKILKNKGIIVARRGRYGSIVVKLPKSQDIYVKPEVSIFAPAKDAFAYHYQKTQEYIKRMIASDYSVGDKLPSIKELSVQMDLSPNTIRKAFNNLAKEGYLVFSRGRYGGTFVIDVPEVDGQAFKWLAVNPQYANEYSDLNN